MEQRNITSKRLRKLRIAHKLTQEDIANRLFISRSCWANYERGVRRPSLDFLQHTANYFRIDINYLLGYSDVNKPFDLSKELLAMARYLTKDGKVDISSLSSLHQIMAIEYINYLMTIELTQQREAEDNA